MERRRYKRLIFGINVYRLGGKQIGLTKDISTGGAFIETPDHFPIGKKLDIVFELPDELKTLTTSAIVITHRKKPCSGIGVEFKIKKGSVIKSLKQFTERWSMYMEQSNHVPNA